MAFTASSRAVAGSAGYRPRQSPLASAAASPTGMLRVAIAVEMVVRMRWRVLGSIGPGALMPR
jgi:hypothetical protein